MELQFGYLMVDFVDEIFQGYVGKWIIVKELPFSLGFDIVVLEPFFKGLLLIGESINSYDRILDRFVSYWTCILCLELLH